MPISLCMLTKNEEKNLAKAINSVKPVVDEIIVVDTGSTDKTKEIAKKFTSKIYNFGWNDNFADARNFDMSEIAKGAHSFALAESKPAISEHAQEHAPPFRAAVLDIQKN